MSRMVLLAMVLAAPGGAGASSFEWVKGTVTTIASQVPTYTVATVNGRAVRFCDPETGADYALKADNTPFDLLKSALLHGKSVEVGVQNFGKDAEGVERLCIERVVLSH